MSDNRIKCKIVFWIFWAKNFFWKTINFGRKSSFCWKRVDLKPASTCFNPETYCIWIFELLRVFLKKSCTRNQSVSISFDSLKIFFFLKKIFIFKFFHRIHILDFSGHYRVAVTSSQVSWGHWRSHVVMPMTSFPNYYVSTDFYDRTSFLGEMDWNSVWNDIFAWIIKQYVILSQNPWLLMSLPVPKSLPLSGKFSKRRQLVFWPLVTSNDISWPWLTFFRISFSIACL